MTIVLESRSRFAPQDAKWTEEDSTPRKEIPLRMRRLANELRRDEREVRFVEKTA